MTLPATTGTPILADQYNQIHNAMNDVMGQGENGYGLAILLSAPITNQNTLTLQAWQNLRVDLDTAHQHITNTVTSITSVTTSTVISAAIVNEFWDAAQFIEENRYQCHPQQYFRDPVSDVTWNTTGGTSSRTSNWGLEPTEAITHEVNVVWASAAVKSYFFNSGGVLEWRPYHTNSVMQSGTALNDLDTEWASFINYVQNQGGWDYDHNTYRTWTGSTATTYSSGTLLINIVANQETDKSIRFVCTFTNAETPQLIVTPSTQYYNILYPTSAPDSKTFTIQNLSSEPAQINRINFVNPQGVQHTADVSQFGGNLSGQTAYTSPTGALTLTKKYVSDSKTQRVLYKNYEEYATVTANFQSYNTVTNVLTISNPSGAIGTNWAITGEGFTNNQSVVTVLTNNTLIVSADPSPITGNPTITFTNFIPLRKLTVSSNNKIQAGWILSSDPTGFTLDQTVIQVLSVTAESTVLIVSGNPNTPLIANQAIDFISPATSIELVVDNTSGIIPGFVANGNGYTGQIVNAILTDPPKLIMNDYPDGNPVFGEDITFTDTRPIGIIPANSSVEFSIDYGQTLDVPATLSAQMVIDATLGDAPVLKTINNSIVISQAPAEDPNTNFTPEGGAGATPPGGVTDGGGSSSGSNWDWVPIVVFIFTGWFW